MPEPAGEGRRREHLPDVEHVIAVSSGKGGVGKTTVSVNLSVALARLGNSVGLLDGDIYGPNVPMMMGASGEPKLVGETIVPLEKHGVKLISLWLLAGEDTPLIWRGPIVGKMIQQFMVDVAWGPLDYLVVDLPPGTGDAQLTLSQAVPLAGAVIVTTPQEVALQDVRRSVEMFRKVDVPILGVVENMSYFECPCCGDRAHLFGQGGADKIAGHFGVPVLARIPILPALREGGDTGRPAAASDSDAAGAFLDMARSIRDRVSELSDTGPEIAIT